MELTNAIFTRRSIRQYTSEPVSEETIEGLLRAAMAAPSAGNAQTWEFVTVTDSIVRGKLAAIHPGAAMIAQAPVAIVVCGAPAREKMPGFWPQDCSAATQNLLLAAHAGGLGAVWVGVYPIEELVQVVREAVGAPPEIVPMTVVALGHPAESLPPEDRFDAAKVHLGRW